VVQLAKTWRQGYAYTGEYSEYRKAHHGDAPRLNPYHQFVVCSQNHDQIGNRMLGERLSVLVDHESLKVAAGCVLLSPFVPLLFMGEEYGERAPFQFFVSHTDDDLIEAVRSGRKEEFASFGWDREAPDPFSQETFRRCRISPEAADKKGATLLVFYKELIRIRKAFGAITLASREDLHTRAVPSRELVWVHYFVKAEPELLLLVSFSEEDGDLSSLRSDFPEGNWNLILDSADTRWGGPGAVAPANLHGKLRLRRRSLALYAREGHSD
jgi:maltooligosyltrehalose trehalohydrolase